MCRKMLDTEQPTYRVKSYLRKRGITDHTKFAVSYREESRGEGLDFEPIYEIVYWGYDFEPPALDSLPLLTAEEAFAEREDLSEYTFKADIYIITESGIVPDRRQCHSSIDDNKIRLNPGRYRISTSAKISITENGTEKRSADEPHIDILTKSVLPVEYSFSQVTTPVTVVIRRF